MRCERSKLVSKKDSEKLKLLHRLHIHGSLIYNVMFYHLKHGRFKPLSIPIELNCKHHRLFIIIILCSVDSGLFTFLRYRKSSTAVELVVSISLLLYYEGNIYPKPGMAHYIPCLIAEWPKSWHLQCYVLSSETWEI
jgi:hypothetical protein